MFKTLTFFVFGIAVAHSYDQRSAQNQWVRITCDFKDYEFEWVQVKDLKQGFHCFMGAELVNVSGPGQAPKLDQFIHDQQIEDKVIADDLGVD